MNLSHHIVKWFDLQRLGWIFWNQAAVINNFNESLFDLVFQPDSMNVDDEISVEDKLGPVITESLSSHSGACDWPSSSSLTARLRRLITAYQRSYRQEQLKIEAEAKGDRRRRRCEQASKLKEIARQERQQRYTGVTLFSVSSGSGKIWLPYLYSIHLHFPQANFCLNLRLRLL